MDNFKDIFIDLQTGLLITIRNLTFVGKIFLIPIIMIIFIIISITIIIGYPVLMINNDCLLKINNKIRKIFFLEDFD